MSRQQRTSIRGSVKTSASEELERKTFCLSLVSPRLRPGSVLFDIVADLPLSHTAEGYFFK